MKRKGIWLNGQMPFLFLAEERRFNVILSMIYCYYSHDNVLKFIF